MVRKVSLFGVMTALVVAISMMFIIPVPATNGFITLCDAGIYLVALLFGPLGGLSVGAFSGGMIDLLSGYPQWIFFSVVIHGLQGWVAGIGYQKGRNSHLIGLLLGSIIMVVGYALATTLLYGIPAGLASIPTNCIQAGFGSVVAYFVAPMLKTRVIWKRG